MISISKIIMAQVHNKEEKFIDDLTQQVIDYTPVGDTGVLRESIKNEKKNEGHWLVGVDKDIVEKSPFNPGNFDYSIVVHNGSHGYYIESKKGKTLTWIDKATGKRRFAKRVFHPATAGNPFIKKAVQKLPKI